MAKPVVRSFDQPEDTRSFSKGRVDLVTFGGTIFGRGTWEPGWRWSTHVKPVVGTEFCEVEHLGVVVSGRMRVVMTDGSEFELGPGNAYSVPPGHDAWVIGDEPYVAVDLNLVNYAKPAAS